MPGTSLFLGANLVALAVVRVRETDLDGILVDAARLCVRVEKAHQALRRYTFSARCARIRGQLAARDDAAGAYLNRRWSLPAESLLRQPMQVENATFALQTILELLGKLLEGNEHEPGVCAHAGRSWAEFRRGRCSGALHARSAGLAVEPGQVERRIRAADQRRQRRRQAGEGEARDTLSLLVIVGTLA